MDIADICIWTAIGSMVGIIMGLTGAGGAIIGVPLFVYLAKTSVYDATLFSLFTVFASSLFNWISQRKNTIYPVSVTIAAFSLIGSFAFVKVKAQSPDWAIQTMFIAVCMISLYAYWSKKSGAAGRGTTKIKWNVKTVGASALAGFAVGATATMTGLGGGVLVMPFLIGVFRFPFKNATATSLFTISQAVAISLYSQHQALMRAFNLGNVLALTAGCLISVVLVKWMMNSIPEKKIAPVRKWIYTTVVIVGVGSLALNL